VNKFFMALAVTVLVTNASDLNMRSGARFSLFPAALVDNECVESHPLLDRQGDRKTL